MSFMSKCVLAVCAATMFSDLALAATAKNGSIAAPAVEAPALREDKAIAPVQSGAKLAVYVKPGFIVRGKNVATVTTIGEGVYCIKATSAAGLNLGKIVPIVSVEWGTSLTTVSDALFAYYEASATGCPSNTIKVMTFDDNGGSPILSSDIAFTLIVQ